MAIEEVVNASGDIIVEIGKFGLLIQALGLAVILWVIFQAITLFFNRKRRLALYRIEKSVKRLESKLNKIDQKLTKR